MAVGQSLGRPMADAGAMLHNVTQPRGLAPGEARVEGELLVQPPVRNAAQAIHPLVDAGRGAGQGERASSGVGRSSRCGGRWIRLPSPAVRRPRLRRAAGATLMVRDLVDDAGSGAWVDVTPHALTQAG